MNPRPTTHFAPIFLHLRLADPRDVLTIKKFYLEAMRAKPGVRREAFPVPSLLEITQSIDQENFLLIENAATGEILAASGLFRLVHHTEGVFGELSGMCTAPRIGGLTPLTIQKLMLAVRIVRASSDLIGDIGSSSLVSFVRKDNEPSFDNLRAAGLETLEDIPEWLQDEFISWFGWSGHDQWHTFVVGADALQWAAQEIDRIERAHLSILMRRRDLASGNLESFVLACDRNLWEAHLPDVKQILAESPATLFGHPPVAIRFTCSD